VETQAKGNNMKNGHYFNEYQEEVWVQDGVYHRLDGPALIWKDGSQLWFRCGIYHREDGPAIIYVDGSRQWFWNGKHHREDGPAIIWSHGTKYYWFKGIEYPDIKNEVQWRIKVIMLKRYPKN